MKPIPREPPVTSAVLPSTKAEPQNWLTYWGDYQGTHYSLLKQIDLTNAKLLRAAWAMPIPGDSVLEGTPIVVDGVMYATGGGNPATDPDDWDRLYREVIAHGWPLADGSGRLMHPRAAGYDSHGAPGVTAQAYAAWYAYAAVDHRIEGPRAHAYAQAAVSAQARGADVTAAAAEGARAASGQPAPVYAAAPPVAAAPAPGLATRMGTAGLGFSFGAILTDPAGRACLYGILCLVAPFVVHLYFPVLPVLGLLYGLRAMGRSNPVLGMAALVLNGLALLLTASIFFGLL